MSASWDNIWACGVEKVDKQIHFYFGMAAELKIRFKKNSDKTGKAQKRVSQFFNLLILSFSKHYSILTKPNFKIFQKSEN